MNKKTFLIAAIASVLIVPGCAIFSTPKASAQQVLCANDFTGCSNGTISPGGGGGGSGGNPTATAGPTAVNGSATTFLRSDGAPAVRLGSTSQTGLAQADSTTMNASSGVFSVKNPVGAVATAGSGYNSWPLPGGVYTMQWGSLNANGSGVATVVFPVAMSVGYATAGAWTSTTGLSVTGPAACNGPPVTICSFTVSSVTGASVASAPVEWFAITK